MSESSSQSRPRFGAIQVGVLLLAVVAGLIHLYVFVIDGFPGSGTMLAIFQVLFVLNFLAYVTLAVALNLPALGRYQRLVRALLASIAVSSFASYLYVGVFDVVGNTSETIEVLLFALLAVDAGARGRGVLEAVLQIVAGLVAGLVLFLILTTMIG